jgi:succinoglycan biosynthesis protein ExoV
MKLTYYKGDVANFGDELNEFMWDKIIKPDFFTQDESKLFLGIGSIIWNDYDTTAQKLVVGSGYGGYTDIPNVKDGTWDFSFVRGKRTASMLNIDEKYAITDAAILTHFIKLAPVEKKYKVSFMPHWQSLERGNWKKACGLAGIHFIDPRDDVLQILTEIQQSEQLVTEAMHGAILADTLRTPWLAVEPLAKLHRNKWFDWSETLDIKLQFADSPVSSVRDSWAKITGGTGLGRKSKKAGELFSFIDPIIISNAAKNLTNIAKLAGQLSDDNVFYSRANEALDAVSKIKNVELAL